MIGVILLIQSNKNGSVQVAPLTGGNVAILDSKERELAVVWENSAWLLLQNLQDKIVV